jgi:hypothetical protein
VGPNGLVVFDRRADGGERDDRYDCQRHGRLAAPAL